MSAQVITFVLPGDVDDRTVPSGGNVYDRRMCRTVPLPVRARVAHGNWPDPGPAARAELARLLTVLPDGAVVLLDGLVACGVPEVVVPQARRLRLAVLVHLPLAAETGLSTGRAGELDARERETLRAVSAVLVTSRWAARHLVERHGLTARRVHVVPPGTDPAPLAPGTDGRSRLLCVASLTPRKGQDLLAEALAEVADLPWSCACVGPVRRAPDYVTRLRAQLERLGIAERMSLVGPRTGTALAGSYAAADLVVLPSRAETFGMVVTEALARGIPVLATAVGAVPDTLGVAADGTAPGLLVPPGDVPALAQALRRYVAEPDLRARLRAAAGERRATLPGWEVAARRFGDVLVHLGAEPLCAA